MIVDRLMEMPPLERDGDAEILIEALLHGITHMQPGDRRVRAIGYLNKLRKVAA